MTLRKNWWSARYTCASTAGTTSAMPANVPRPSIQPQDRVRLATIIISGDPTRTTHSSVAQIDTDSPLIESGSQYAVVRFEKVPNRLLSRSPAFEPVSALPLARFGFSQPATPRPFWNLSQPRKVTANVPAITTLISHGRTAERQSRRSR